MAGKWFEKEGFRDDVVISTRVRLARNVEGFSFPRKMSVEESEKLSEKVSSALSETGYGFEETDIASLSELKKNFLLEEYTISKNLFEGRLKRKVFTGNDGHVSIMLNEEDHLRLQCIYAGFEPDKAYDLINKVDNLIGEKLSYAFSEKYGYLTTCPTNVGTGMRVSFMLHLPALSMTGHVDELFAAIGKLGIAVRGVYGEGSKSTGHIYQISNQVTLGLAENEIIEKMTEVVNRIISQEKDLRNNISKENGIAFADKIMRSYGILKYASVMSTNELLELLSKVRLGVSMGMIEGVKLSDITNIMILSRPAHIMSGEENAIPAFERDVKRAKLIKDILKKEE